jgi:hypothetical protein
MQDVILIDVPEDATDIKTHILDGITKIVFSSSIQDPLRCGGDMLRLPPGSWTIVEQTEEGAAKIVKKYHTLERYADYSKYEDHDMCAMHLPTVDTALESLHSWIRSQGKEPDEVVIVKKK